MKYNNIGAFLDDLEERMDELQSEGLAASTSIKSSEAITASRGEPFDTVDAMEEAILNELGAEEFLDALTVALSYDTKAEVYKYIIRMYEVPFGDEEE